MSLESSEGKTVKLPKDLKGQWTLLYFYPKDDTPGCTKQACSYRDHLKDFKKNGLMVYGVSLDDLKSHNSFINKFNLNFPLLSDAKRELSEALGVYGDKKFMGRSYKGLSRDTFLIDTKGVICQVWRKVKPELTVEETLAVALKFIG